MEPEVLAIHRPVLAWGGKATKKMLSSVKVRGGTGRCVYITYCMYCTQTVPVSLSRQWGKSCCASRCLGPLVPMRQSCRAFIKNPATAPPASRSPTPSPPSTSSLLPYHQPPLQTSVGVFPPTSIHPSSPSCSLRTAFKQLRRQPTTQ